MKIIGVSMRMSKASDYDESRDVIAHDWCSLLEPLNVLPVMIPNNLSNIVQYLNRIEISHLLLTGGESVGNEEQLLSFFERSAELESLPKKLSDYTKLSIRDITEVICLRYALQNKLPVFAVCRGLQLINACFGGKLSREQFVRNNEINDAGGAEHISTVHPVEWVETSESFYVNSYHADAVYESQIATALNCLALSNDGVVEALQNKEHKITSVQWHPEREKIKCPLSERLIEAWLNS